MFVYLIAYYVAAQLDRDTELLVHLSYCEASDLEFFERLESCLACFAKVLFGLVYAVPYFQADYAHIFES